MKNRCLNKNFPKYERYGERGISICDEWIKDFQAFAEWAINNGYNDNFTIDRIDNNGNYCPENCRWVDTHIQSTNKNIRKNNKTGFIGIYKNRSSFYSQISVKGKRIFLGSYKIIRDAVKARNEFIKNNNLKEYKIQEI